MKQTRFLEVVSVEEAKRRLRAALPARPPAVEDVPLPLALDRVTARDVGAPGDVPAFDRADLDGFAVRAADLHGASDERPVRLRVVARPLSPGQAPHASVRAGEAIPVATGAVMPRGADAVVPVEATDPDGDGVFVRRPTTPGAAVTTAGSDVVRDEVLVPAGTRLTSRETGTLAACGLAVVPCVRPPVVAILSTGDELVAPGEPLPTGRIHDANGTLLADAVREEGGVPRGPERVADDPDALRRALARALVDADLVLLSGGTSKGAGDLVPEIVDSFGPPGLLVHGVDLKPGKPLGLAVCRGKPVALLPGFPTSAIFTFHEVVAPLVRRLAGRRETAATTVRASLPRRLAAERGRTEYLLVALVAAEPGAPAPYVAHPMGKGSGSVTAFARADGFVRIPGDVERLDAGEVVDVVLLGRAVRPADLVVIGSHCAGLDAVLSLLAARGVASKPLLAGSTAGLEAARAGGCDVAPIHLLDPATGRYNDPFVPDGVALVRGWRRRQVLATRADDPRFRGDDAAEAVAGALRVDPAARVVTRQRGSGTRVLVDRLLAGAMPPGAESAVRSHAAVAAAIAQGRADFGICTEGVARAAGLATRPVADERYDFAIPANRLHRPAVRAFLGLLDEPATVERLAALGLLRP